MGVVLHNEIRIRKVVFTIELGIKFLRKY